MAGIAGFEPTMPESESGALPLGDIPSVLDQGSSRSLSRYFHGSLSESRSASWCGAFPIVKYQTGRFLEKVGPHRKTPCGSTDMQFFASVFTPPGGVPHRNRPFLGSIPIITHFPEIEKGNSMENSPAFHFSPDGRCTRRKVTSAS